MSNYFRNSSGYIFLTDFPQYHKDDEKLPKNEGARLYREQCKNELLALIKPNQTVYSLVRHVSSSGMSRRISLFIVDNGELRCIDHLTSVLTSHKKARQGGLTVSGCGMDMEFHLVYSLGRALWPNGTPEPHGTRNGAPDSDGGYALKHSNI